MFGEFAKVWLTIVNSTFPAFINSTLTTEDVVLPSGRTKKTQFAWVISLRTTLAGESYLKSSYEDVGFLDPREGHVPGLDVDEATGALLTAGDIGLRMAANKASRPQNVTAPAVVAADLG